MSQEGKTQNIINTLVIPQIVLV